jgi:hypothetical protein
VVADAGCPQKPKIFFDGLPPGPGLVGAPGGPWGLAATRPLLKPHAAHVSLKEGKAFCFMSGPDEDSIRKAHVAINFPYDSITEVRRVTGADMRIPQPAEAQKHKAR